MASTITALTGGGGVAVAGDTSGVLELKTNNGTTAMTIDTSQNVGIGTSSPTNYSGYKTLAISGSTGGVIDLMSGSTVVGELFNTATDVRLQNNTANPVQIWTNGTERMRIAADGTITASNGNVLLVSGTAVSATGTSIDFTGIPSWVKRITVMLSGVSTNGTSNILIQIGSGSITTSGYASGAAQINNTVVNSTAGFLQTASVAAVNQYAASCFIFNVGSNSYLATGSICTSNNANNGMFSNGVVTLSGALDRVRITTVNGTDTFDAGTINILYE